MSESDSTETRPPGRVSLLGAGPGDPALTTLRTIQRLQEADVVLYDALAHPELLDHCRADARRIFVGKRAGRVYERQESINQRLLKFANGKR